MEDCYYFLYSKCARGDSCAFRHSEAAKMSSLTCSAWEKGIPCANDCPYRHSLHHLKKRREDMDCYWEARGGCTKEGCAYRHRDKEPRTAPYEGGLARMDMEMGDSFQGNYPPYGYGTVNTQAPSQSPSQPAYGYGAQPFGGGEQWRAHHSYERPQYGIGCPPSSAASAIPVIPTASAVPAVPSFRGAEEVEMDMAMDIEDKPLDPQEFEALRQRTLDDLDKEIRELDSFLS